MKEDKQTSSPGSAAAPAKEERNEPEPSANTTNNNVELQPIRPTPSEPMYRTTSHVSGPDDVEPPAPEDEEGKQGAHGSRDKYWETGDEVYDRLSNKRKSVIVAVLSFCAFLSPVSSTSVLSATPEVAAEYNTSGSIINLSNAAYMVFMAFSPIVWGPMSQVFGRRTVWLIPIVLEHRRSRR